MTAIQGPEDVSTLRSAAHSFVRSLLDLLLSRDPHQRLRIQRSLLSILVFVVCIGLIAYACAIGLMDRRHGAVLAGCIVTSCTGFYLVLRSGLNLRWSPSEPALTLPQILAALTWICGAYGTTREAHGGTLMLFALVQVFGIFTMRAHNARVSSVYAVVAMGATMLFKTWTDPVNYPAHVEWVYFVFVATIMPTIAQLATQLATMRQRLKAQKNELEAALERIHELATRDELTGLVNRREMVQILGQHAISQARNPKGFYLAILDLDHFKRINDSYGHATGDSVLRNFAAHARRLLRETDVISRWGGEEFLLLMPQTGSGDPRIGIERLRLKLMDTPVCDKVPELRVTFSAGLTAFQEDETIEAAIERADQALYRAKALGRGRTELA